MTEETTELCYVTMFARKIWDLLHVHRKGGEGGLPLPPLDMKYCTLMSSISYYIIMNGTCAGPNEKATQTLSLANESADMSSCTENRGMFALGV